ncbi:class I SAM-dependent methyltransferase [Tamlana haliotis]|uniref:Class I SAM-dependent methyltransferase n=2 Tax=Pseudotamlana haliotis TaxID=2614804 RepID=A0A6N6MIU0_9FLAO|nr:class I SAM-dependent methyltransferase [Tamlana haliotis]
MDQIYDQHLWGGQEFDFYSGDGSHNSEIINPYLEAVSAFLKTKNNALTICDLGCGDFNIGKELLPFSKKYFAIDIVEKLIDRNKSLYKSDKLEFHCLDIAKNPWPKADCIILRQVLQHLSNKEIQQVLEKLKVHQYVILTEHIPEGDFIPNKNIISGQGIRLKQNSGVNLLEAPFFLKVKSEIVLAKHFPENNKGRIETKLYQL